MFADIPYLSHVSYRVATIARVLHRFSTAFANCSVTRVIALHNSSLCDNYHTVSNEA